MVEDEAQYRNKDFFIEELTNTLWQLDWETLGSFSRESKALNLEDDLDYEDYDCVRSSW